MANGLRQLDDVIPREVQHLDCRHVKQSCWKVLCGRRREAEDGREARGREGGEGGREEREGGEGREGEGGDGRGGREGEGRGREGG